MTRRPPPLVLGYHGVATVPLRDDRLRLFVAPGQLRRDVRLLRGWGYELSTFSDLAGRVAEGDGAGTAALTFDDGLADNLHTLAPLLGELEAPATVFVVTGWLGGRHPDAPGAPILTASELHELHRPGIEIGAHTVTHRDLTRLPTREAFAELRSSRTLLEDLIGAPVRAAAYPYGASNAAVREACGRAGIEAACSAAGSGSWADPLDLPREGGANGDSALGLRLKRSGRHQAVLKLPGARWLHRRSAARHSARWLRAAGRPATAAPARRARPSPPR